MNFSPSSSSYPSFIRSRRILWGCRFESISYHLAIRSSRLDSVLVGWVCSLFVLGSDLIEANTNEDIDWASNSWKENKRSKKMEKLRKKQQEEIEQRMQARSSAAGFVRSHPGANRFAIEIQLFFSSLNAFASLSLTYHLLIHSFHRS